MCFTNVWNFNTQIDVTKKPSNVFFHLRAPPPFVCLPWVDTTLGRHYHSLDECSQAFPLHLCTLQAIKNWMMRRHGNKAVGFLAVFSFTIQAYRDLPTVIGNDRAQPVFSTNQPQVTPSQSLLYFVHYLEWLPISFPNRTLPLNLGITLATIWITAAAALCFSLSSHHVTIYLWFNKLSLGLHRLQSNHKITLFPHENLYLAKCSIVLYVYIGVWLPKTTSVVYSRE